MARADFENMVIKYIDKIIPGSNNKKLYEGLFKSLTDSEFKQFVKDLENNKLHLVFISPNYSDKNLSVENNLKIAKELGHDFFQKVWIGPTNTEPKYLTNIKFLVYDLPIRRTAQITMKKINIPENNNTMDLLTGQPTGASKGSKLTYPEIQILMGGGFENTLAELLKNRGGDIGSNNAMNALLIQNGSASQEVANRYATGVESTKTLNNYLKAMHIASNINQ